MILHNLRVTVRGVSDDAVGLKTEQGQTITAPRQLLPNITEGTELFLAIDRKPLVGADQHAKDVLNEIIGSQIRKE